MTALVALATPALLDSIDRRARNEHTRRAARLGFDLTWEQADALGPGAFDWLHRAFGVLVVATHDGVRVEALDS